MRYRHVLIAYDGSPESELALAHAVAIAQVNHARLALVAVVPHRQLLVVADGDGPIAPRLTAAAETVPDDLRVTTRLLEGVPADQLLRAAREHDVLVIGAGPVADEIAGEADVPVIVVHSARGPDLAA